MNEMCMCVCVDWSFCNDRSHLVKCDILLRGEIAIAIICCRLTFVVICEGSHAKCYTYTHTLCTM